MECRGTCRLRDQLHIASTPQDIDTPRSNLSGCQLCGALHVFTPSASSHDVAPISLEEAARRFGLSADSIRSQIRASRVGNASPAAPQRWRVNLTETLEGLRVVPPDDEHMFAYEPPDLILRTHAWPHLCWQHRVESSLAWGMGAHLRLRIGLSVSGDLTKMFAIGIGQGDDYADPNTYGHFFHIYGSSGWSAARGPTAKCQPVQLPLTADVPYSLEFEVGAGHSHMRVRRASAAGLEGFTHRMPTSDWHQFRFKAFAVGSPEVRAPAELRIHSLQADVLHQS